MFSCLTFAASDCIAACIADMELSHWVTGSVGHLGHLSGSGHRVNILTRCETRVSRFSKKMPKMQNVHLKCWNDKSHCQVSVVGLKSLDVSPCSELLLLPMIIKNSLAWEYFFVTSMTSLLDIYVHYRTRSPGQLGLRVAGFPGHWVTKCDPVPCLVHSSSLVLSSVDCKLISQSDLERGPSWSPQRRVLVPKAPRGQPTSMALNLDFGGQVLGLVLGSQVLPWRSWLHVWEIQYLARVFDPISNQRTAV